MITSFFLFASQLITVSCTLENWWYLMTQNLTSGKLSFVGLSNSQMTTLWKVSIFSALLTKPTDNIMELSCHPVLMGQNWPLYNFFSVSTLLWYPLPMFTPPLVVRWLFPFTVLVFMQVKVLFILQLLRTLISSWRSLPFIGRGPCGENPGLRMLVFWSVENLHL